MLYTIANNDLTVTISTLGAELMSIKDNEGREYLWQGDEKYWKGRAYNLFPICGRLTEGKYTYQGKTYEMNLHGFVRKSELKLISDRGGSAVTFRMRGNEETKKMYPFRFNYLVKYALNGNELIITYALINSGTKELIYAFGGHPGFNVPMMDDKFEDYYLEFSDSANPRQVVMSPTCYTTEERKNFSLRDGKILDLKHSLFDNDAIVLENVARAVGLKSKNHNKSVTVSYPEEMKYLAFWHTTKSDAPFVAIEPWTSLPSYDGVVDDLETKKDMFRLQPGGTHSLSWSIKINK